MYFEAVKLSAHRQTVTSSIASATEPRRTRATLAISLQPMAEPTKDDVDAIVGPATPHFAYQLRARVLELVEDLPESHEVRRYAEEKAELLDRLGYASSKAEEGPREPRTRPGWETIPSTAPADEPLKP
jgi:hypothetical protein